MSDLFQNAPPYIQALIAGIITWLLTALVRQQFLYLRK